MAETKILNECAIFLNVSSFQVIEKTAAAANHLEQPLPTMMILRMRAKVVGEVIDPVG